MTHSSGAPVRLRSLVRRVLLPIAFVIALAALGAGVSGAQVADEDVPSSGEARQIKLTASPGRVTAGRLVRIRFRATAPSDDDVSPPIRCAAAACAARHERVAVSRALVSFAGRRVRTDSRGRASMLVRLSARVHRARAARSGFRAGTARVRAVGAQAGEPRFTG